MDKTICIRSTQGPPFVVESLEEALTLAKRFRDRAYGAFWIEHVDQPANTWTLDEWWGWDQRQSRNVH